MVPDLVFVPRKKEIATVPSKTVTSTFLSGCDGNFVTVRFPILS